MRMIAFTAALLCSVSAFAAEKPAIRSQSDLPPTRFTFTQPPSEMMASPEFVAMLPSLRAEGERVLRDYDVQDTALEG